MRSFVSALSSALTVLVMTAALPGVAHADPGQLRGVDINSQGNNFGYWEYLPAAYDEAEQWPVLIFLAGIGENGNGVLDPTSCAAGPSTAGEYLCRNLRHGPQRLIWNQLHGGQANQWDDEERPFIVIAPQNPAPLYQMVPYNATHLDTFVQYVLDNYAVDPRRIYLTGMSMGGYSAVLSMQTSPDRFAAVSIMPGIAGAEVANAACGLTAQNIWAFHGENDGNPFNPTGVVNFIRAFNDCPAPRPTARITMYQGAGHDVWTRTINPADGMDDPVLTTYSASGTQVSLDPYDTDIYTWLLSHDKPVVDAGEDLEVDEGATEVSLTATTIDEDAIVYTWTQQSGPSATLAGTDTATLTLADLEPGEYVFEVLAVDTDGQHARDTVTVSVASAAATSGETDGDPSGSGSTSDGSDGTGSDGTGAVSDSGTAGDGTGGTGGAATEGSATEATSEGSTSDGPSTTRGGTSSDGETETSGSSEPLDGDANGCSCSSDRRSQSPAWTGLLLLLGFVRRRRR